MARGEPGAVAAIREGAIAAGTRHWATVSISASNTAVPCYGFYHFRMPVEDWRGHLMMWVIAFCGALFLSVATASAGPGEDCHQQRDQDLSIRGCSILIHENSHDAGAYISRGVAYGNKGEY